MTRNPTIPSPETLSACETMTTFLHRAVAIIRTHDEVRARLEELIAHALGIEEAAVHLPGESIIGGQARRMVHRSVEGLSVTAGDAGTVSPATETALSLLGVLAPFVADAERMADSRRQPIARAGDDGGLLGTTPVMRQLRDRMARAARRDFTALIQGESGVGKELVARQVHALSDRRHGPFVPVNCAAIVETLLEAELFGIEERTATGVRGRPGKFELAAGGTLFLDEVSDLSASAQAKLLRAIQELAVERVGGHGSRHVNVRLIAATNRPLEVLVDRGEFRRDLFYRLNAIEIAVPPLRARREDIPILVDSILQRFSDGPAYRLSREALDALLVYEWPGNVRELERAIERALTLARSDVIDLEDLSDTVTGRYREILTPHSEADDSMRAWGSRYARLVLRRVEGNKREACRVLDISYHTLRAYLSYAGRTRNGGQVASGSPVDLAAPPATASEPAAYRESPGHGVALVHEGSGRIPE